MSRNHLQTLRRRLLGVLLVGVAIVGLSGCQELTAAQAELPFIPDAETLGSMKNPPKQAVLNLAGTPVEVEIEVEDHEGGVPTKCYELVKHGESLDRECYQNTSESFALVEASNLMFKPAIPLVEYGERLGKENSWKGMVHEGSANYKATAKITTCEASLSVDGVDHDTTLVTMDLVLDVSGVGDMSSNSVTKRLTFWIHPQFGVIQREFGTSKRSPVIDQGAISGEGPTPGKLQGVPTEKKVETNTNSSAMK